MKRYQQRHEFLGGDIVLYQANSHEMLPDLFDQGYLFDQVVCDPPYGIAYKGAGHHRAIAYDDNPDDIAGWSIPFMAELMKDDSAMYVCTREDVGQCWKDAMSHAGLNVKTSVIWDKKQWTMGDSAADLRRQTEMILIAHKGRALLQPWMDERFTGEANKLVKRDTCLWVYPVPRDRLSQRHPTPKPPEIMERAMLNHSNTGDRVLDPFMGGGPVAVAAVRRRRRYVGIELDTEYYGYAVENVAHALGVPVPVHNATEF